MGEHDLSLEEENTDPQIREIITRIVHPNYKPPSMYNDIGLYRLNTPVKFSRFIFPVCLNSETKLNTEQAVAIGWGRTDSGIIYALRTYIMYTRHNKSLLNLKYASIE